MTKKNTNKTSLFFFSFLMLINLASAQVVSPFNKLVISDTSKNYSFIVSGHFHGESTNKSTFPASTILAGIDTLNNLHSLFLMSLGDMFIDVNDTYINNYQKSLFSKLKMPLFNAVGNHDLANGNLYEKVYGKEFYFFKIQSEIYIVLNSEVNDGSIIGEQLEMLRSALAAGKNMEIKNIFIFIHRPLWAENNSEYKMLFEGNTRTEIGSNNFEEIVKPLIVDASRLKPVFFLSGSLAGGSVSFFYHRENSSSITFMQTAIRDLPRDAVLLVSIKNGKVAFKGISLTGQKLQPIESYDLDYWKNNTIAEEPFNYRLLPFLTKKMLLHYYFWIGFVSSLSLILILRFVYKIWKRRG